MDGLGDTNHSMLTTILELKGTDKQETVILRRVLKQ
jgi:hypothetical protein